MMTESANMVLGPKVRYHQDSFDENNEKIITLLEKKRAGYNKWQNDMISTSKKDRFKHLQRKVQRELRRTPRGTAKQMTSNTLLILTTPRVFSVH